MYNYTKLAEIDLLKAELDRYRKNDSYRIREALDIEYTYESNRIEGNTLTLMETELVVNQGLTISGKSMQDHLEAINHSHAIAFIKDIAQNKLPITEPVLLDIHRLILRSINDAYAGKYRDVPVSISGTTYVPPQPYLLAKAMEDFFLFYEQQKTLMHPVVLSALLHEKLVTIHPFIDGNGRTARLLMNLQLISEGYPLAILKGDNDSRLSYYNALQAAQLQGDTLPFVDLVTDAVHTALERYLSLLRG